VLSDIAHTQAHDVRGPVATILGLLQLFNHDDPTDPINGEVINKLNVATEKLDNVVKEVVYKENRLRYKDGPGKK
jgi:signal transduction histidine kinase